MSLVALIACTMSPIAAQADQAIEKVLYGDADAEQALVEFEGAMAKKIRKLKDANVKADAELALAQFRAQMADPAQRGAFAEFVRDAREFFKEARSERRDWARRLKDCAQTADQALCRESLQDEFASDFELAVAARAPRSAVCKNNVFKSSEMPHHWFVYGAGSLFCQDPRTLGTLNVRRYGPGLLLNLHERIGVACMGPLDGTNVGLFENAAPLVGFNSHFWIGASGICFGAGLSVGIGAATGFELIRGEF